MTDEASQPQSTLRRFVTFPLSLLVIEGLLIGFTASLLSAGLRTLNIGRNSPLLVLVGLTIAVGLVLVYLACKRWIERQPDTELPFDRALPELAIGLLGGAALFGLVTLVVSAMGGFTILGVRGTGDLWNMMLLAIISASFEEILFRGVILRHLETLVGTWAALLLTSALFGAAHLMNPDSSPFAALALAIEAGLLLGGAYLLTRRLWVPIGLHAAWNFTQGWVFSVPVSGGEAPLGFLVTRLSGPDWLTGGAFGLEASVVAMTVAGAAGALLTWRAWRIGGFVPPLWAARSPD